MKKFINNLLKKIGYKIIKNKNYAFDHVYGQFLNNKSIIIDIGSNEGQSIDRFLKIIPDAKIHCFEPVDAAFKKIKNYKRNNLKINKIALGHKVEKKLINVFIRTSNSSFNDPIKNSFWERKKKLKFNSDILIKNKEMVNIITLDSYIKKNKIKFIDLIKIDTQGFEEKVLQGCKNILKKNIIKFIEVEYIMGNQYQNRLNIIDLEKHLIKNSFRLFGINQKGDLLEKPDMNLDLLYANTNLIKIK